MSQIINDVRAIMQQRDLKKVSVNHLWNLLQQVNPSRYNSKAYNKNNIEETLNHYKKLSVVYVDEEQNVIFL